MIKKKRGTLKKIIKMMFVILLLVFLSLEVLILYTGNREYKEQTYDYVIVLGAKVNGEIPSLALKNRLDSTLDYWYQHQDIPVIVTGGQGEDEYYPESMVMKKYLMDRGVAEDSIIEENKSISTYENFLNSYSMVGKSKVLVATNDFHMFRALMLAKKVGFEPEPLNAQTPKVIEFQMYLREFPATIKSFIVN